MYMIGYTVLAQNELSDKNDEISSVTCTKQCHKNVMQQER